MKADAGGLVVGSAAKSAIRLPWAVSRVSALPWSVKRWLFANPLAWRLVGGACRRLGWNENCLGVHRVSNGPLEGLSLHASHVNHLWVPMGGYEPELLTWLAQSFANPAWMGENKDAYDVGAYIGVTALFLAKSVGRVAAFEPSPANREQLTQNLSLNPQLAERVRIHAAAVSDRVGLVEMSFDGVQSTNQIKVDSVKLWGNADQLPTTQTPTLPLDSLLNQPAANDTASSDLSLQTLRPGFIKVDVEGAELLVLAGAQETLRRFRPAVLIETHNEEALAGVLDALAKADYAIRRFDDGRITNVPPVWAGGYGHIVGVPNERATAFWGGHPV